MEREGGARGEERGEGGEGVRKRKEGKRREVLMDGEGEREREKYEGGRVGKDKPLNIFFPGVTGL